MVLDVKQVSCVKRPRHSIVEEDIPITKGVASPQVTATYCLPTTNRLLVPFYTVKYSTHVK